jgi:hypothetical protein
MKMTRKIIRSQKLLDTISRTEAGEVVPKDMHLELTNPQGTSFDKGGHQRF